MDEECATTLKRRKKAYFILSKELEDIHLGAYDDCIIRGDKEDFFERICSRSQFVCKLTSEGDKLLLKSEAEKRWNRVMLQGGTNLDWKERQMDALRQGKPVSATPEADAASINVDLVLIHRISVHPSKTKTNSLLVLTEAREENSKQVHVQQHNRGENVDRAHGFAGQGICSIFGEAAA
jgi:hypothetical protein